MLDAAGQVVAHAADQPCLAQLAACAALCNDSSLLLQRRRAPAAPLLPPWPGALLRNL